MASVCANAMPSSGKTAKNEPVSTVTASRENTKPSRASIAIIQTDNSSHSQPTKNQIIPDRAAFAPLHDGSVQKAEYRNGQERIKEIGKRPRRAVLKTQIIARLHVASHCAKHRIDGIHQHSEPHRINQAGDKIGFEKSVHRQKRSSEKINFKRLKPTSNFLIGICRRDQHTQGLNCCHAINRQSEKKKSRYCRPTTIQTTPLPQ